MKDKCLGVFLVKFFRRGVGWWVGALNFNTENGVDFSGGELAGYGAATGCIFMHFLGGNGVYGVYLVYMGVYMLCGEGAWGGFGVKL